jgi:membrane protease subunit (stomatin/prohibitin family)
MREDPIYQTSYMGFWIKVYPNRVDFKSGVGSQSIPINQIASVQIAMMGIFQVTLETSGGMKYSIPTRKKKEIQQAIYDAQARLAAESGKRQTGVADEIMKLNELKEKGVITQEEFDKKKKQLLDL